MQPTLLMLLLFALLVAMSWGYDQIFTGRAALLHLGAFTATIMTANVFFQIMPNQRIVVADLKAGRTIEQPMYDYDQHDRKTETLTISPAPIIILEGIHALSVPEVKPLIDLSIYVDTPDDLRLARRLRRDVVERDLSVESVLAQYLGTVRAAHYRYTYPSMFQADLVIADEGLPAYGQVRPSADAIDRMLAPIETRLRSEGVI